MLEQLAAHDLLLPLGVAQLAAGSRLLFLSLTWWTEAARARQHARGRRTVELVG